MSLTEKTYARFWASMSERYGSRWVATYGEKPSHAWCETLAAFTPRDIQVALDSLANRAETQDFPPTEPAFKALLITAARGNAKPPEQPGEFRRGYWRATIIIAVADELGYRFSGIGDEFEPVLIANRTLGVAMRDLLNEVDELEATTGQRTSGQEAMVQRRCREIAFAFRELKRAAA